MHFASDYLDGRYELADEQLARLAVLTGGDGPGVPGSHAPDVMAKLLREIGRDRATPSVLGQQLKLARLLDKGELEPFEELLITIFANTLAAIDAFEKSIEALWEESRRNSAVPQPVPIDETTMELVDGPLATWGGRG